MVRYPTQRQSRTKLMETLARVGSPSQSSDGAPNSARSMALRSPKFRSSSRL